VAEFSDTQVTVALSAFLQAMRRIHMVRFPNVEPRVPFLENLAGGDRIALLRAMKTALQASDIKNVMRVEDTA